MSELAAPDWALANSGANYEVDDRRLMMSYRTGDVDFGNIPSGWTIHVDFGRQPTKNCVIRAESVAGDVRLVLTGTSRYRLIVEMPVRFVTVDMTPQGAAIELANPGTELTVITRVVKISGLSYALRVEPRDGREVLVGGDASVEALLASSGSVRIEAPISEGARFGDLTGALTTTHHLNSCEVAATALDLEAAGGILNCRLVVRSIVSRGEIRGSRLEAETHIYSTNDVVDSQLRVWASVATTPAIWLAGRIDNPPSQVELKFGPEGLPDRDEVAAILAKAAVGPQLIDSRVNCSGEGDVFLNTMTDSEAICAGSLIVGGECRVKRERTGSLKSIGALRINVAGHLLVAAQLTIEGDIGVQARGFLTASSIAGPGTVEADCLYLDGDIVDVTLQARNLELHGAAQRSTLEANEMASLLGPADGATTARVHGSGVIGDAFQGDIVWHSSGVGARLSVSGSPKTIEVNGAQRPEDATLTWSTPSHPVPPLSLSGALTVEWSEIAKGPVVIEALHLQHEKSLLRIDNSQAPVVEVSGIRNSPSARVAVAGSATLNVTGSTLLHVICEPTAEVELVLREKQDVEMTVSGPGVLRVAADLALLHAIGDRSASPWLDVPDTGRILELTGDARLKNVEGTVAGRTGRRKEATWPWSPVDENKRSPRIHDIADDGAEDGGSEGVVVAIDPTYIPYHHLLLAERFQVFEPDAVAMIDYTRPTEARDKHDARRVAYKAQRISDMVASSAASGGGRSAAGWTAARTHHQALTNAPIEKILRLVHRSLGYGQRPAPPLVTYLIVVFIWTTTQWAFHHPRPGRGPGAYLGSMWHMALVPASFLVRVPEDSERFHYIFGNAGWNAIAFLTMGVPLVFGFIALRHFMAAPRSK